MDVKITTGRGKYVSVNIRISSGDNSAEFEDLMDEQEAKQFTDALESAVTAITGNDLREQRDAALEREESLLRDAERYRWLRDTAEGNQVEELGSTQAPRWDDKIDGWM